MNAEYVFNQVSSLLDDPEKGFCTDDYLVPFLQSSQDDLVVSVLNHANLGRMKFEVTLGAVAAGAQSLGQYFESGQPLETLEQILAIWEKPAGAAESQFTRLNPVLLPSQFQTGQSLNRVYTFTGSNVLIPGANQSLDFKVYGAFKPSTIRDNSTALVPGTESILKYGVCAAVSRARGSRASASDFDELRIYQQSSLFNNWMMQQQKINVRSRRFREDYWSFGRLYQE